MSARKGVFFLAFASGKEKKRWQLYSLAAQVFGLTMCKAGRQKKEGKKEKQKGNQDSQKMNTNSQHIRVIHRLSLFHGAIDSFAALQTDFFARFFRRMNRTTARSSATGDLYEANGGFSRRLRGILTGTNLIFKESSSFVQYIPLRRTFSRFGCLSSFFVYIFYPQPTAQALVFRDYFIGWNLIQLDFLREGCGSWRPIGSWQEQKMLVKVSARKACRTSFFALLPIFPNCIPQGAKKKQVFRLYAFGKGKHSTGVSFKPKYQLWK